MSSTSTSTSTSTSASVSTTQSKLPAPKKSGKPKPTRKSTAERNKALIDKHKLYATDNTIDRINLGEWLLPTNKDFPNFIRKFNKATMSEERSPIKYGANQIINLMILAHIHIKNLYRIL